MNLLFAGIEKLINEHGSSSILRERIALAADQYSALEKQVVHLQLENKSLRLDLEQCQQQRRALEKQFSHSSNPHGHVCDNCGSPNLKRSGSRPDPTFGVLGVKEALFICDVCGKESAFSQNP